MIHNLKSKTEYFDAVWNKHKTFEIRKNDRGFKVGDFVILQDWATYTMTPNFQRHWESFEEQNHSGRVIAARIDYVTDYEQKEGYVVLGIAVLHKQDLNDYNPNRTKFDPFNTKE